MESSPDSQRGEALTKCEGEEKGTLPAVIRGGPAVRGARADGEARWGQGREQSAGRAPPPRLAEGLGTKARNAVQGACSQASHQLCRTCWASPAPLTGRPFPRETQAVVAPRPPEPAPLEV